MRDKWTTRGQATIPQALNEACLKWPDKVYLDFSGDTLTFAEVESAATRFAHGLATMGVQAGDRVCSLLDNVSDQVCIWFAANKLGAIFVPLNTNMKGEYLRHQVADTDAAILVAEAHYADRILEIENGIPAVRTLILRGALPERQTRLAVRSVASIFSDDTSPIVAPCKPGDLALLIYTSGTTGPSKGCMVSHNYAVNFGRQLARAAGIVADDVIWTPCPMFHSAAACGIVVNALLAGATASLYPRFSASQFWPEIERSRASAALLLSTMLSIIPAQPDTETSKRCHGQLRTVWGAPLTAELIAKWKDRFGVKNVAPPGYGMTEATLMIFNRVDDSELPDGASGRRCEDFDVRIIDDEGEECGPGEPGEIIVRPCRPDIMFHGYWRRPEATVEAMRDLWFHTGDVGKFDARGFFYFVDRKKDYLRRGGENISSFEVETTFLAHVAVAEAAIHAVRSELSEDEVKLTAVLKADARVTEEELCRWSLERLPNFAVPRFIEFRASLPRTPSGRLQKFLLEGDGVTQATWDRKNSDMIVASR